MSRWKHGTTRKRPCHQEGPDASDVGKDTTTVSEFLKSISVTLKKRGLLHWKFDDVERALRQSMVVVPEDVKDRLEADFERHVETLVGFLSCDVGATKKVKSGGETVADDALLDGLRKVGKREHVADVVVSRVPAPMEGVCSLVEGGAPRHKANELEQAVQYVRICASLGGRCSTTHERVASFAPFATYMKTLVEREVPLDDDTYVYEGETGIDAFVRVVHASIGSIYSMIVRDEGAPRTPSFVSWNTTAKETSYLQAALTCHDVLRVLVRLRILAKQDKIGEDCIQDIAHSIRHMVHLVSPYGSLGLIASQAKEARNPASIDDLILFLASSKQGLSCGREELKSPVYVLYMHAARRALSVMVHRGMVSLASSQERDAADTMPPMSIVEWLTSKPPSAIIQVLLEKSNHGLGNLSRYLLSSINEKELQALASLSYSELADGGPVAEEQEADGMLDDLLFYESTEGELNVLPKQWDTDDEDDEEEEEEEEEENHGSE